jgi:hypothetical protein
VGEKEAGPRRKNEREKNVNAEREKRGRDKRKRETETKRPVLFGLSFSACPLWPVLWQL